MADTAVTPAADTAEPEQSEPRDWGRVLDVAGGIAAVVLVIIVADIVSDGRVISRRLQQRRAPREDDPVDSD